MIFRDDRYWEQYWDQYKEIMIKMLKKKNKPKKVKIEIELDQEQKIAIDIVSKAMGLNPQEFILLVIRSELHYIKSTINSNSPKENLSSYYTNLKINIKELEKLNLLEGII